MLKYINDIGSIQLKEKVIVADPGNFSEEDRELSSSGVLILNNVKPGEFLCFLRISDEGFWGKRVSYLIAIHKDYLNQINFNDQFQFDSSQVYYTNYNCAIEVDSGKAGIFNFDYLAKPELDVWDYMDYVDDFYEKACKCTSSDTKGGVIEDNGVVSSSGYGDFCYSVYTFHDINTNDVIGIIIDYNLEDVRMFFEKLL